MDGSAAWIAKTRRWAGRREGLGVVREEPHESAIVGSDLGTRNVCRMEIVDSHYYWIREEEVYGNMEIGMDDNSVGASLADCDETGWRAALISQVLHVEKIDLLIPTSWEIRKISKPPTSDINRV